MNADAEITIVIPVYNRQDVVGRTLASIADQDLRPLNVVLVDNASSDGSLDVLQNWKQQHEAYDFHITLLEEPTPGACAARNRGLDAVTTRYVMFFDSDDTMTPDHCSRALATARAAGYPDIVGWDIMRCDIQGTSSVKPFYIHRTLWHNIMHGSMATQRYMALASVVRQAGGWDNNVKGWNDIELGARLLQQHPTIVKAQGQPTVTVYATPQSITGHNFSHAAGRWEDAMQKMASALQQPRQQRMLRLKATILAGDYRKEGATQQAETLLRTTLAAEPSAIYKALLTLAYRYQSLGGRATARLFSPFFIS